MVFFFTISEENVSGNVNANVTAEILDVVGCCLGVAMWLLRYFGWFLGGCLLAQVCLKYLKKM